MNILVSFLIILVFMLGLLVFLAYQPKIGLASPGMILRRAVSAPVCLSEFLTKEQKHSRSHFYYFFSEETVRSLGHRFVGRFDEAVIHWEDIAVLDLIIEYKFPSQQLPSHKKPEDVLQAGLYALALMESGVSCSSTKLVIIYCLQDRAKKCLERKSIRDCWRCSNGRSYVAKFKPNDVLGILRRLDEFWYEGRKPRPTQEESNCRVCPYSNGRCSYSLV